MDNRNKDYDLGKHNATIGDNTNKNPWECIIDTLQEMDTNNSLQRLYNFYMYDGNKRVN